jgi:segregation and condensation protein B
MNDIKEESLFEAPPIAEQERMVEAILFASAGPVSLPDMAGRMPHGSEPHIALQNIQKRYLGRGVEVFGWIKLGPSELQLTLPF